MHCRGTRLLAWEQQRRVFYGSTVQLPGARVLEDRYGANVLAMAVAKGQPGWLACVSGFIEEARSSGLVQRAIASAGLGGVEIVSG